MAEAKNRPTRLRQIALVVEDLEKAKKQLTYILGVGVLFEDPAVEQFGLKNFLVVSPIKPSTTAGRLLQKRGEGGYMIIMQNISAASRRDHITSNNLGRTIWGYDNDDVTCVQYHPKGIPGGMMPELDSHAPCASNPTPLQSRFSPWHACGSDYPRYVEHMKRAEHLNLEGCILRLAPADMGHEKAARRWEEIFGVARSRNLVAFTNARLGFMSGREGDREGSVSITVGVKGRENFQQILDRSREMGLCGDEWINMCGVKWYFSFTGHMGGQHKL
ncbi:hypothetical protein P154DRAFT_587543 [Amniculicola lignicola CBS 123094]|uniref:Glyoxalase-like domain-containing protein n=1 Tax=Amniculicola lignicola CBS 123094 TaxID=1392246 RepID=A0A6A5VWZ1_9PLEO|nr:hypothetical protein P154DRAFT_587543 [Amniculicola lignicola CBS 123094]